MYHKNYKWNYGSINNQHPTLFNQVKVGTSIIHYFVFLHNQAPKVLVH